MLPLKDCPAETLRPIMAVLCDIDGTLTCEGRLPAAAYGALERIRGAGLLVVPITGRPAGWCDHIARMWPVDGVVGENGAFYFHYDGSGRKMIRRYRYGEERRRQDRVRLQALAEKILSEVPGAAIAADQPYREADLAIDFREDVAPLAMDEVDRIVKIFEDDGATAKISSIHVNGWYGEYDKLGMTKTMFSEVFSIDLEAGANEAAFVGDSPNDSPMFQFFENSIGVANIADFSDRMTSQPNWVTEKPGGLGFAEFADALLRARE